VSRFATFTSAIEYAYYRLKFEGREIDAGSWQGYETQGKPDLMTREVIDLQLEVPVNRVLPTESWDVENEGPLAQLQNEIRPNLPWADDHFAERVSRVPSNPGEEYYNWPWWRGQVQAFDHEDELIFSHTYQERFWPKQAGSRPYATASHNIGIRYGLGDLDNVVQLLAKNPYTRQATFPIFFPEDTGVVHGGRTPCTLHYHFMCRDNQLHMWYPIRSCDYVRHFRDDLYLACKLMLWVLKELRENELRSNLPQFWVDVSPGTLFFTAYSFHYHKGDEHHVTQGPA
jgi:hypothetical protein